jgi:hypothetical protein
MIYTNDNFGQIKKAFQIGFLAIIGVIITIIIIIIGTGVTMPTISRCQTLKLNRILTTRYNSFYLTV